jgi:hypothetical protein
MVAGRPMRSASLSNAESRLARIKTHPCGAKRHPRSSVFYIPRIRSVRSFLGVAQGAVHPIPADRPASPVVSNRRAR